MKICNDKMPMPERRPERLLTYPEIKSFIRRNEYKALNNAKLVGAISKSNTHLEDTSW